MKDCSSLLLSLVAVLLVAACLAALATGSSVIPPQRVVDALIGFDGSREHVVVATVRLPRVMAGLLAGAALAVAGAIMQAVTANPLASPGLLGINAGAAFAVVLAMVVAHGAPAQTYVWCAFAGAAVAAFAVHLFASFGPGGATPLKLALSGAILSSFLASLTMSLLIFDRGTLDAVRLWSVGSLAGRTPQDIALAAPYILSGLVAAFVCARQIDMLGLGVETARAFGQNQTLWRGISAVIVVMLAGSAVAMTGPVGFVGLVVPHVARMLVGVGHRTLLPFCALCGALLVVVSDGLLRHLLPVQDMPVGVTMAMIGAPFFVWLARTRIGGAR